MHCECRHKSTCREATKPSDPARRRVMPRPLSDAAILGTVVRSTPSPAPASIVKKEAPRGLRLRGYYVPHYLILSAMPSGDARHDSRRQRPERRCILHNRPCHSRELSQLPKWHGSICTSRVTNSAQRRARNARCYRCAQPSRFDQKTHTEVARRRTETTRRCANIAVEETDDPSDELASHGCQEARNRRRSANSRVDGKKRRSPVRRLRHAAEALPRPAFVRRSRTPFVSAYRQPGTKGGPAEPDAITA